VRKCLQWLVLLCAVPCAAQTVIVSASNLRDGLNPANGTIVFSPVNAAGAPVSYHTPGGQVSSSPITAKVVAGAFSVALPDVALTIPANLCFAGALNVLSGYGFGPGYSCIQPTQSNYWCSNGLCDFDNYIPSLPALPVYGGGLTLNGYAGAFTFSGPGVSCDWITLTCVFNGLSSPVVPTIGDSDVTGQVASLPTVNLVGATPATGKYRINYYANGNTACGSGTVFVTFTFSWVDPISARSVASIALTLGPSEAPISNSIRGAIPIYALASTAVSYNSTVVGSCATGGPASYDAHVAVEELQ